MAGVNMVGDEGNTIGTTEVPTIGGIDGIPGTAPVVSTSHLNDGGTPPSYPETPGVGPFPAGTAMGDSTPADDVN